MNQEYRLRFFAPILLIALLTPALSHASDFKATKLQDTVIDPEALTIKGGFGQAINGLSFQQEALITHKKHQYVGYYDGARRVCIARRKLPAGEWQILRFEDYDFKSNDAHNTISIGICPNDGTIHIAFDHHGHELHYRTSKKNVATNPAEWDPALFEPIRSYVEKGKPIRITYPRFFQNPDGALQFCYRQGGSGNGDRMLVDYDPETGKWQNTRQIDSRHGTFTDETGSSKSRCSYPNGYDYGPRGKLHATWVWREHSQGANHDLLYAYSKDRGNTWLNNAGHPFDGPPHVNSPGLTVVKIPKSLGLMNTHGQAIDSKGRVHAVMWHCTEESLKAVGVKPGQQRWGPPEARRYHHYWRDTNGKWHHNQLPGQAGNRPKVFIDRNDNAFLIFAAKRPAEKLADGHLHRRGDLKIAAASARSQWKDFEIIHTEPGPFVNEMLADPYRWKSQKILSVMTQQSPQKPHDPTPLRILDFTFKKTK
ncbi:MAG: BNR repeat-containing protein [Planctomycetota bacterium]|jgi:hypothetical protein